ncbi:MAG: sulfurtransferase [Nitriliruptoraceae bacterium]
MAGLGADLLVDPSWLAGHLDDERVVIVDCPWDGAWWRAGNGGSYGRAHIPGAICQTGHPYIKGGDAADPSVWLPSEEEVVQLADELGIGPDHTVVVYDDRGSLFAARLWWVLRYYGHEDVRLLDGGWQGWLESGLPVSAHAAEAVDAPPFIPRAEPELLATLDEVLARHDDAAWQVIDARSDGEWEGTELSGNRRGGHIPGALHLEWKRLLTDGEDSEAVRRFLPPDELRSTLSQAGVDPDRGHIPLCQAAVRGAFMAFALELAGYGASALYDGSMAEWANLDDTPLVV